MIIEFRYAEGIGMEWSNGQDIAPHELYELGVAI